MQDHGQPGRHPLEQRERIINRTAAIAVTQVDDDRQPSLAGDPDLCLEGSALLLAGGSLTVVVEPGLADRPHVRMGGEISKLPRRRIVETGSRVGVAAHAREYLLVGGGGGDRLAIRRLVKPDLQDPAHPRLARRGD